jgi:hypothetical protein
LPGALVLAVTWCPAATSPGTRCRPSAPVAPVTKIRMIFPPRDAFPQRPGTTRGCDTLVPAGGTDDKRNRPGRRAEIEAILHGCVRHAGLREAYVSMTCTRGRMAPGSRDLRTARNRFYCYALPFIWVSTPDRQETGASMRVSDVVRIPSQSVDPRYSTAVRYDEPA